MVWVTSGRALLAVLLLWAVAVCHADDGHIGTRAFALLLAKHGVPCGVISPPVVMAWRPPDAIGEPKFGEPRFDHDAPFGAGLAGTLAEFNRRNGVFRATEVGGVVHIRSVDEAPEVMLALLTQARFDADGDAPAVSYLSMAATAIRRGESRAIIGAGAPMPDPESALLKRVRLAKGSYSALRILDEVVRQATGVVWFVTYNAGPGKSQLRLGLMDVTGGNMMLSVED